MTYSTSNLTRATKVHNPNGTSLWVAEEDILWFKVTMDDIDIMSREKEEGSAQLLGKLTSQVEGHAPEVGITQ